MRLLMSARLAPDRSVAVTTRREREIALRVSTKSCYTPHRSAIMILGIRPVLRTGLASSIRCAPSLGGRRYLNGEPFSVHSDFVYQAGNRRPSSASSHDDFPSSLAFAFDIVRSLSVSNDLLLIRDQCIVQDGVLKQGPNVLPQAKRALDILAGNNKWNT